MYGQTFLLSLAAYGLAGVPPTLLSLPEPDNPVNTFPLDKAPVDETVTFHH